MSLTAAVSESASVGGAVSIVSSASARSASSPLVEGDYLAKRANGAAAPKSQRKQSKGVTKANAKAATKAVTNAAAKAYAKDDAAPGTFSSPNAVPENLTAEADDTSLDRAAMILAAAASVGDASRHGGAGAASLPQTGRTLTLLPMAARPSVPSQLPLALAEKRPPDDPTTREGAGNAAH